MVYSMNYNNIQKNVSKNFLVQYFSFLDFLKSLIHNDEKKKLFNTFYNKNLMMKKANPRFFIKKWYTSITQNYHNEILNNNIDFFLNKSDYEKEIKNNFNEIENLNNLTFESKIKDCIENFKELHPDIQNKFIEYIRNLTLLSILYIKK